MRNLLLLIGCIGIFASCGYTLRGQEPETDKIVNAKDEGADQDQEEMGVRIAGINDLLYNDWRWGDYGVAASIDDLTLNSYFAWDCEFLKSKCNRFRFRVPASGLLQFAYSTAYAKGGRVAGGVAVYVKKASINDLLYVNEWQDFSLFLDAKGEYRSYVNATCGIVSKGDEIVFDGYNVLVKDIVITSLN